MSISLNNFNNLLILTNYEYRCPKCSLVPFINILTNENKLFMSTKCINNHIYLKPFEEMKIMCKTSPITKNSCAICENKNKKKIFSNNFYYCSYCYNFFCSKHAEIHSNKENHNIYCIKKFDSICIEYKGTSLVGFCSNHNKNYCFYLFSYIIIISFN